MTYTIVEKDLSFSYVYGYVCDSCIVDRLWGQISITNKTMKVRTKGI